jgi:Tol biopolymer transport system component
MVTGRRAFDGEDVTDVLARVLERDADLSKLDTRTPAPLRRLLRRCLDKDPKRRLPDIGVALLDIDDAIKGEPIDSAPGTMAPRAPRAWIAGAALISGLLVGSAAVRFASTPAEQVGPLRLQIDTPRGNIYSGRFAVSPDGRHVIFQSPQPGQRQMRLWLRSFVEETAQPIPGTDDALGVIWSPDGRSIAFTVRGELKRLELSDGRTQTLASMAAAAGGAWSLEGGIIFPTSFAGPLYSVAPTGGEVTAVTRINPPETSGHVYPQFLPGGRRFLYYAFGSPEGEGIYLGSLDSGETRRLVRTDSAGVFVPPDLIVFAQEGSLVARRLDLSAGVLEPDTMTVAAAVATDVVNAYTAVSSGAGTIAYRSAPEQRQFAWLDRSGRQTATLGPSDASQPGVPRISPDGRSILIGRTVGGNTDIWQLDVGRGSLRPLTRDPAADFGAIWSPDGSRIVFQSDRRAGNLDLYVKSVDDGDTEVVLLQDQYDKNAHDWSADGRYLLYRIVAPATGSDVWALPLFGGRMPVPVTRTMANEVNGRFSPDGRWVAYQSNETGRAEIFVQPFPGPGPRRQVSIDGGFNPEWRGDGRELFFVSPDERIMSVPVSTTGTTVQFAAPVALFAKPEGPYTVTSDGMRFLVGMVSADASPITILLNWTAGER